MVQAETCAAPIGGEPSGGGETEKPSGGGAAGAAGDAACALAFCDGDIQRADAAARKIPGRFRGSGDAAGAEWASAAVAAEAAATAAGSAAAHLRCSLTNPCLARGRRCSRLWRTYTTARQTHTARAANVEATAGTTMEELTPPPSAPAPKACTLLNAEGELPVLAEKDQERVGGAALISEARAVKEAWGGALPDVLELPKLPPPLRAGAEVAPFGARVTLSRGARGVLGTAGLERWFKVVGDAAESVGDSDVADTC